MNIISGQFDPDIHNIDLQRWYRCHIDTSGMGSILASTQSKNSHVRANRALFTSCVPHVAPPTLELSLQLSHSICSPEDFHRLKKNLH